MNEQLEEALKVAIDKMGETATFPEDQIPLVAQEYLNWVFYSNVFAATLALIIGVVSLIVLWKCPKKFGLYDNPIYVSTCIFSGLICLSSVIISASHSHDVIKVVVAPRVVLIEKASDLVKK